MHYNEILAFLHVNCIMTLSLSTLKRELKHMKFNRKRDYSNLSVIFDFLQNVLNTSGRFCGYSWIHQRYIEV